MTHRECLYTGLGTSEHVVQLFDEAESRAATVGDFLHQGWLRGENLLVAARPDTWAAVARELVSRGCSVSEDVAAGRILVLDAAATLASIVRNGHPIPERFGSVIGMAVERLSGSAGKTVRAYGELVDVLAAQGELACAWQLEGLWNDLATRYPIALLCGYTSGHFGDPRTAGMLRRICDAHDCITSNADDLLGSWLVGQHSPAPTGTAQ